MNVTVISQITARRLLRECGVGVGGKDIQPVLIDECVKEMDPYVPMDTGTTKNTRIIEPDGVTYVGPHARFIYNGLLMVSPSGSAWAREGERKHVTGIPLKYHGAPTRGPFWDMRMWADKGTDICRRLARKTGGRPV